MFIPILPFHNIVETFFGFPGSLVLLFGFLSDFVLINDWECQAQMFRRISVEFCWIARYLVTHLFLLELPYIELLSRILKYIDLRGNVKTLLKWSSRLHRPNMSLIRNMEIWRWLSSPLFHRDLKFVILAICLGLSFTAQG